MIVERNLQKSLMFLSKCCVFKFSVFSTDLLIIIFINNYGLMLCGSWFCGFFPILADISEDHQIYLGHVCWSFDLSLHKLSFKEYLVNSSVKILFFDLKKNYSIYPGGLNISIFKYLRLRIETVNKQVKYQLQVYMLYQRYLTGAYNWNYFFTRLHLFHVRRLYT